MLPSLIPFAGINSFGCMGDVQPKFLPDPGRTLEQRGGESIDGCGYPTKRIAGSTPEAFS